MRSDLGKNGFTFTQDVVYRPAITRTVALVYFCFVTSQALGQLPVPFGLNPGDNYHLVFNSSMFSDATSADINFYNLLVQEAADAAGIGSTEGVTWSAIVSTSSIDAKDNAVVGMNTPVYNMNLELVATGLADMWDGILENALVWDEFGQSNPVDVWTGTLSDGTGAEGLTLGQLEEAAWCGRPTFRGAEWLNFLTPPTSTPLHLYALSQELTVTRKPSSIMFWAGDADQDLDFDQIDLVQVQIAAKYLTGQRATWGEGDWNGAPGGSPGDPPTGDGLFNQLDIIAGLAAGVYQTGPYAAVQSSGSQGDGQTSIIYNAASGELGVDAPTGTELTSINVDSAAAIFTGQPAQNVGGSFDNDADGNIFNATSGSSFGALSFGNVAQTGLSEDFVVSDLTVVGSLAGGGDLAPVDLIYVPEPAAMVLAIVGVTAVIVCCWCCWRRDHSVCAPRASRVLM